MTPILQSEASECGLARLALVAKAHGLYLDLAGLATESRADGEGRCVARAQKGVGMGAGAGFGGEAAVKDSASWPAGRLTAGQLGKRLGRAVCRSVFCKGSLI
jgi:hypothetical protein